MCYRNRVGELTSIRNVYITLERGGTFEGQVEMSEAEESRLDALLGASVHVLDHDIDDVEPYSYEELLRRLKANCGIA